VTTDLFVAASGVAPASLIAAVPPSCRREIEAAPPVARDGGDLTVSFPEWTPRQPAVHLLPSFSALTSAATTFRFELSVKTGTAWSPWVAAATIGEAAFPPLPAAVDGVRCDVDVFLAARAVGSLRLRLRLAPDAAGTVTAAPWLVALSAAESGTSGVADAAGNAYLRVPPLSQMEEAAAIRSRICSPTCLTMVLKYWGAHADVSSLARAVFHEHLDLYGVWPSAIRAAGAHGVAGYLLRVPEWTAAAWCLAHGMPLIVSVRYTAGELSGAAIEATDGHLLVLTGYEGGTVIVNDPAAPTRREVERRYRLDELQRVWLERTGVAYVLFRPAAAITELAVRRQ
jgi:Peptidase_C39 like family